MSFKIHGSQIKTAMDGLSRAIGSMGEDSVVSCVADGKELTFYATNPTKGMACSVRAEGEGKIRGKFSVNPKMLVNMLGSRGEVELTLKRTRLGFRSTKGSFQGNITLLPYATPEGFDAKRFQSAKGLGIDLRELLRRYAHTVNVSLVTDAAFILQVYDVGPAYIMGSADDYHFLSVWVPKSDVEQPKTKKERKEKKARKHDQLDPRIPILAASTPKEVLSVPGDCLKHLIPVLGENTADLTVDGQQALVWTDRLQAMFSLVDSEGATYQTTLADFYPMVLNPPKCDRQEFEIATQNFVNLVDALGEMCEERTSIQAELDGNRLHLRVRSAFGSAKEQIRLIGEAASKQQFHFSPVAVADTVRNLDSNLPTKLVIVSAAGKGGAIKRMDFIQHQGENILHFMCHVTAAS